MRNLPLNGRSGVTAISLLIFTVFICGCGDPEDVVPRDFSAGPLVGTLVGVPLPWCEDFPSGAVYEPGVDCLYKYLLNAIPIWMAISTVAFVADIEPDCDIGGEQICATGNPEDCMTICPFRFDNIETVVFGDPSSIERLASLSTEKLDVDGKTEVVYLLNGSYPETSWWTISPGTNLIFAQKACYPERFPGGYSRYLLVGVYPVDGDVVYDADDVTVSLSDLVMAADDSGIVIDEVARYEDWCL